MTNDTTTTAWRKGARWAPLAALGAALALAAAGCGDDGDGSDGGHAHATGCPSDHDHFVDGAIQKSSEAGLYQVTLRTRPNPPRKGVVMLNLQVADADGAPVTGATVEVDATMPAHGHGLGSVPTVVEMGEGAYMVHDALFQMAGYWVVTVSIEAGGERDEVRFELCLEDDSDASVPDGGMHMHGDGGASGDGGMHMHGDGGASGDGGSDAASGEDGSAGDAGGADGAGS